MTYRKVKAKEEEEIKPDSKEALFNALGRAEAPAIRLLVKKVSTDIKTAARRARLTPEDIEELINDVAVITISSIRKGKFQYINFHPAAYALGVARKLIANHLRKNKIKTEELDHNMQVYSDFNPETYLKDKERQSLVGELLKRVGEPCHRLLQMKFFENLRDNEIIEQKLSPYSSVGSLKSKRSQCMKKLADIAKQAGVGMIY